MSNALDNLPTAYVRLLRAMDILPQPTPQPRDPVEPDLQWADADDENEWQRQCEEKAYQHMDACDERWRSWLLDPVIGPDGGDVARLLSLYLKGDDATEDDRISIACAAMELRKRYVDYLTEHD